MSPSDQLIEAFKSENTEQLLDSRKSRKPSIIFELEEFAHLPHVTSFILAVAGSGEEFYLARIEAFKVLEVSEYSDPALRNQISQVVGNVLRGDKDLNVRNYAAMCAANFIENADLFSVVVSIVLDDFLPSSLRWNAFAAIKARGVSSETISVVERLGDNPEFVGAVNRLLSEWGLR